MGSWKQGTHRFWLAKDSPKNRYKWKEQRKIYLFKNELKEAKKMWLCYTRTNQKCEIWLIILYVYSPKIMFAGNIIISIIFNESCSIYNISVREEPKKLVEFIQQHKIREVWRPRQPLVLKSKSTRIAKEPYFINILNVKLYLFIGLWLRYSKQREEKSE